jgi:glycerophosphoryl diester phosphodiesterase
LSTEAGPGDSEAMSRPPKRPLVLGHRGYRSLAPENTLPAFLAALAHGADGVEFDVQKEPGGAYVVVHDPPARDGTAPRLRDVLAGLPRSIHLDVELKGETLTPADCPRILAELTAAGVVVDRMMISSFISELLPPWKAWGIETALLLGSEAMRMGIPRLVGLVRRIGPTWLNPAVQAFGVLGRRPARLLFRLVRLSGRRLAFWTVNTEEQLRDVSGLADIVISDDVDRAVAFFPKAAETGRAP